MAGTKVLQFTTPRLAARLTMAMVLAVASCNATTYPIYANAGGGQVFNGTIQYEANLQCDNNHCGYYAAGTTVDLTAYPCFGCGTDTAMYRSAIEATTIQCGDPLNGNGFFYPGTFTNPSGTHHYTFVFKFIEQVANASGQRVFDIKLNANGTVSTLASGVDIYSLAGQSSPYSMTVSGVAVSASSFRIQLVKSSGTYDAILSGLQVIQID